MRDGDPIHAVVNALAHIHIETAWLIEERFLSRVAAAATLTGGGVLGIHLVFHSRARQQRSVEYAFDQQAANEVKGNQLGEAGKNA